MFTHTMRFSMMACSIWAKGLLVVGSLGSCATGSGLTGTNTRRRQLHCTPFRWRARGSIPSTLSRGILQGHCISLSTPQAGSVPIFLVTRHVGAMTGSLHIPLRSEEHTSELQSPYVISYAVFCL